MINLRSCDVSANLSRHLLPIPATHRPLQPRHVAMDGAPIQHIQGQRDVEDVEVRWHVAMRQLWIDVEVGNVLPGARDGELLGNSGGQG